MQRGCQCSHACSANSETGYVLQGGAEYIGGQGEAQTQRKHAAAAKPAAALARRLRAAAGQKTLAQTLTPASGTWPPQPA